MPPLRFATLCSGVDVPSLAWERLGWKAVFFSEIKSFPNRVLAARWPTVPNLGDMTKIDGTRYRDQVDVLWASFPCQDFSEAGRGKGVSGANGILTLAGVRLVEEINPPFFCFENVRGLLTNKENAFGQFLGRLAGELGPLEPPGGRWGNAGFVRGPVRTIAWRKLDAQHFGLAQQRERVFLVACPVGGADPRDVLFERLPVQDAADERPGGGPAAVEANAGGAIAVAIRGRTHEGVERQQVEEGREVSFCLRTAGGSSSIGMVLADDGDGWALRRLLPVEYERLQGMPDGHTLIDGASDTERYSACGNSLPVPVVRWIGERILETYQ